MSKKKRKTNRRKYPGIKGFIEPLEGRIFGKLTVIGEPKRSVHKSQPRTNWLCQCECGNRTRVLACGLKRKITRSCGCLKTYIDRTKPAKRALYYTYMKGAETRGLGFELSEERLIELCSKSCHYCGSQPETIKRAGTSTFKYNGLDRVDSSMGYNEDNIVTCCGTCNIMKKKLSVEQFLQQADNIHKHNRRDHVPQVAN